MRAFLAFAVTAVALATVAEADSIGVILNTFSGRRVDVHGYETGHKCWSSSVSGNNDLEFQTSNSGSCVSNFDELTLAMDSDATKNCSTRYSGVYQLVPSTGTDVYLAQATLVGPSGTEATTLCANNAATAMQNTTAPVQAYSTCTPCTDKTAIGTYAAGTLANKGPIHIEANLFSSVYARSCASSNIGVGANNGWTYEAGNDNGCTSPINKIAYSAPYAQGCNVTLSPDMPHALAMWVGYERNAVCVSPVAVASVNDAVTASFQGACPPCTGAPPGDFPASFDLQGAMVSANRPRRQGRH